MNKPEDHFLIRCPYCRHQWPLGASSIVFVKVEDKTKPACKCPNCQGQKLIGK